MKLLPGDVVLVHSDGLIGWLIRKEEERGHKPPAQVNHAGIIANDLQLIEALPSGVVKHDLIEKYADTGVWVSVYRYRDLTDCQRSLVAQYAEHYVGDKYGFIKIALHLIGWQKLCFWDKTPICSYVDAMSYWHACGLAFGFPAVLPQEATPDDIWDRVNAPNSGWDCIHQLGMLTKEKAAA